MNMFKSLSLAAAAAVVGFTAAAAQAQISIDIGPAPVCPYGYYDYAPYACAPYGYYGPEWFPGGIFVGAGPWFYGHEGFRGAVNHRYDVHRGYRGELPRRGEMPHPSNSLDRMEHFRGTEMRDGRGHAIAMGGHEAGGHGGGHEGGGHR